MSWGVILWRIKRRGTCDLWNGFFSPISHDMWLCLMNDALEMWNRPWRLLVIHFLSITHSSNRLVIRYVILRSCWVQMQVQIYLCRDMIGHWNSALISTWSNFIAVVTRCSPVIWRWLTSVDILEKWWRFWPIITPTIRISLIGSCNRILVPEVLLWLISCRCNSCSIIEWRSCSNNYVCRIDSIIAFLPYSTPLLLLKHRICELDLLLLFFFMLVVSQYFLKHLTSDYCTVQVVSFSPNVIFLKKCRDSFFTVSFMLV